MRVGRSTLIAVSALVMLAARSGAAAAQSAAAAPSAAGHWTGAIQTPGQELQVEVDILANAPGTWVGTISIPAQNIRAFPLSSLEVLGDAVSFAMKGIPGDPVFKGKLSAEGGILAGDLTQGGAKLTFSLKRSGEATIAETATSTPIAKELEGAWEGSLNTGAAVLRLKLTLANRAEGGATGTMVSVDQGGVEIPIATVTQSASRVELALPTIGGSYSGELKDGRLTGDWKQGAATLPLVFARPPRP